MVLVKHILESAQRRLALVTGEASLSDAAEILANPTTPLAVVCDGEGRAAGVISRGDVVKVVATAGVGAWRLNAGAIMTKPVLSCHVDHPLQQVWETMNSRSLRAIPLLDDDGRPRGVVHARDVATALLDELGRDETLLRDYVLGVGYQ
jgi:CBS domain-containing protein